MIVEAASVNALNSACVHQRVDVRSGYTDATFKGLHPMTIANAAAVLAEIDAQYRRPRQKRSYREIATQFTGFGIDLVRRSRERRRWLKGLAEGPVHGSRIWTFYDDFWTPEANRLVLEYRARAREARAKARLYPDARV